MTKREYLEDWFYNCGYWKTDIDAMSDTKIINKFCEMQKGECVECPFINDCPPFDDDEICEWIHDECINVEEVNNIN